jgi:hypothetical protein
MFSYSTTSFSFGWKAIAVVAVLFVLSDNMMNKRVVDASSHSSSRTLSGVVNIVGRKDVGRTTTTSTTLDEDGDLVDDLDADDDTNKNNHGQRFCACQPSWYTLRLNRSLDCDDRTIFTNQQPGIQSIMCTHPQDKTANAQTAISSTDGRPYVPTRIHTVIIQELDHHGRVLKKETLHGPFADGAEITYISVLATTTTATTDASSSSSIKKNSRQTSGVGNSGNRHQSTTTPTTLPALSPSLQNDIMVDDDNISSMKGSESGEQHHNHNFRNRNLLPVRLEVKFLGYPGGSVWSMAYSQDCFGGPILEKGHTIVRAVLVRFIMHFFLIQQSMSPLFPPYIPLSLSTTTTTTTLVGCWQSSCRILSGNQQTRGGGDSNNGQELGSTDDKK